MATGYVYFGEAAGARVIRYGQGFAQVGAAYNLEHKTWDFYPSNEDGAVHYRTLVALIRHTNGYQISIQPILDGVALPAQTFSGGPPAAGAEGIVPCRAWVLKRGRSISAIVKTLNLLGETEIVDISAAYVPLRPTP